jgi:malonate transporter
MLHILSGTGPIHLIIAVGFICVCWSGSSSIIMSLCWCASPYRRAPRARCSRLYLAAYALGSLVVVLGAAAYAQCLRRKPMPLAALQGQGMSASAFIGYPIILQLICPPAGVLLALTMIVESLLSLALSIQAA